MKNRTLSFVFLSVALSLLLATPSVRAQEEGAGTLVEEAAVAAEAVAENEEASTELDAAANQAPLPEADEPAAEAVENEAADEEALEDDEEIQGDLGEEDEEAIDEEEPSSFAGLVERFPTFFAVTHPIMVHFPIALWIVGAFFVIVPITSKQVPLTCLVVGMLGSVPSVLSGWYIAEENGYMAWNEFDFESIDVLHRWVGLALLLASILLCLIAWAAHKSNSRSLGAVWRIGLIALALGVGYEGHLGGSLIHPVSVEEAFQEWVNPEAEL